MAANGGFLSRFAYIIENPDKFPPFLSWFSSRTISESSQPIRFLVHFLYPNPSFFRFKHSLIPIFIEIFVLDQGF